MEYLKGHVYRLTFPTGAVIIARLDDIWRYPATGMPPDYIFNRIHGDKSLSRANRLPGEQFPLPAAIMPQLNKSEEIELKENCEDCALCSVEGAAFECHCTIQNKIVDAEGVDKNCPLL